MQAEYEKDGQMIIPFEKIKQLRIKFMEAKNEKHNCR